jgi:hypothetical protein
MVKTMKDKKDKIVEIITGRGPSLPSHLSKEVGLSLLFTAALLSEMVADKTLRLSYLKIGGSPLYFLPGQEEKLEEFTNHLANPERETFRLLKEKKWLDETKLSPLQRVTLREIKDFAFALKASDDGKEKTFWRFFTFSEDDAKKEIQKSLEPKVEEKKPEIKKEKIEVQEKLELKEEVKEEKPKKIEEKKIEKDKKLLHPEIKPKKKVREKTKAFKESILDYLKNKNIDIYKNLDEDNKICIALVDSEIGLLKYLVYGLDKKSINEADLSLAHSEGQQEKLPVLILTTGKLTTKALEYSKKLGNLVISKLNS